MIVNSENIVERRDVEVGAKYEDMLVVEQGLNGDERVVVEGIQRARTGAQVAPKETQLAHVAGEVEAIEEGGELPPEPDAETAQL